MINEIFKINQKRYVFEFSFDFKIQSGRGIDLIEYNLLETIDIDFGNKAFGFGRGFASDIDDMDSIHDYLCTKYD